MVDMVVYVGKSVVDRVVIAEMAIRMARALWKQLDGKKREYMVEIYFPLLPFWH